MPDAPNDAPNDCKAIELLRPDPVYEVAWRCGGLDVEAPCGCWHRFLIGRYGGRRHLIDGALTLCDNDNCSFTWKAAYTAARKWVDSNPKELEDGEAAATTDAAGVDGAAGSHRC